MCFTRVWPSCLGVKLHPLRPASSRNFRNLTVKRLLLPSSVTVRVHHFHVFNPTTPLHFILPQPPCGWKFCPMSQFSSTSRKNQPSYPPSNWWRCRWLQRLSQFGFWQPWLRNRGAETYVLQNATKHECLCVYNARIWHMIACDDNLGKWWKMQNAFWPEVILRILLAPSVIPLH